MLADPRNNNENSRKGDEEARQEKGWNRFVSGFRVAFAIIYLGSIFISGICWLTGTDSPVWPWRISWSIFHGSFPHGTDTRVYLTPESGKEQEVNMDQWFQYKETPWGLKRYSELAWTTDNAVKLANFVAGKNDQAPFVFVEGPIKSVKVVHRWWPITRGRRPTEADRAKGQTQNFNVEFGTQATGGPGLGTGDLKVGDGAPYFELQGSDGNTYRLSDYEGKQAVVIAWFPKAFTGG